MVPIPPWKILKSPSTIPSCCVCFFYSDDKFLTWGRFGVCPLVSLLCSIQVYPPCILCPVQLRDSDSLTQNLQWLPLTTEERSAHCVPSGKPMTRRHSSVCRFSTVPSCLPVWEPAVFSQRDPQEENHTQLKGILEIVSSNSFYQRGKRHLPKVM